MQCPRDGSTLKTRVYEAAIEIDECPTCHGMWLDKGELDAVLATVERDYSKELQREPDHARQAFAQERQTHEGPIFCPKCNEELISREYAYCSQVIVDTCPEGCGLWLDAGELRELELFFERTRKEVAEDERNEPPLMRKLWVSLLSSFEK